MPSSREHASDNNDDQYDIYAYGNSKGQQGRQELSKFDAERKQQRESAYAGRRNKQLAPPPKAFSTDEANCGGIEDVDNRNDKF